MSDKLPSAASNPMPAAAPSDASGDVPYRVTLPEFEGPLDLLLHLCQTHELDILNISVSFIAEKYIEYLEVMQNMSVEVAADYLVMAAHLAYLKSRELVPSPEPLEASEDGEEPVDPREELIRRLLEYQKYKHAAENLGNRPIEGRNVFVRGVVLEPAGEKGFAEHSVWKLLEHWAQILDKAKPQYTHDVVVDRMSISDRINQIVDLLESNNGMVRFDELLGQDVPEAELRHKVVVSLLAVLELARLRVVRILQEESTGSFFLAQTEGANLADARNLNVTSAKEAEPAEPAESEAGAAPLEEESQAQAGSAEGQEEPAAAQATADNAESEIASLASDTARLNPQEDVIFAPSPASAEKGEEVIDGQTQEEQRTTEE
jgi:segregation and condensation protein A